MSAATAAYAQLFKVASQSAEVGEVTKHAVSPRTLALLGLGGAGIAAPAYALGRSTGADEAGEEADNTRNWAFAAGTATGLAAPPLLKALGRATGLGVTPGSQQGGSSRQRLDQLLDGRFTEI